MFVVILPGIMCSMVNTYFLSVAVSPNLGTLICVFVLIKLCCAASESNM